jgi:UDP-glucose 4-epimerase
MRFFSVYQGYRGAEAHKGEFANIVAQFADDVASGESPVVYGDGTHSRDLTHVSDVVRGCEMAADHELTGIYNLGTGEQYTANEVVATLTEILDSDVEPEHVENPIDDDVFVSHTMADYSKMNEATGWEPEVSFEEGMRMVCEPYLE